MSAARHPKTYRASEVMKRMVEYYFQCYFSDKKLDWDEVLTMANFGTIQLGLVGATVFQVNL